MPLQDAASRRWQKNAHISWYRSFGEPFKLEGVLQDSFLDFFAITLRSAEDGHSRYGWPEHPYYAICLVEFVTQFRGMRAAQLLSLNGYSLDGFALQRNLKDQAIALGAIAVGISSFPALYGLKKALTTPWTRDNQKAALNSRKNEEKRIFNYMIGQNSGLDVAHLEALSQWNELFHTQVHGARLSNTREVFSWIQEKKEFGVGPRIDDQAFAVYMNRFTEIAWMTLRSLPFLQTAKICFDERWLQQWEVLDTAFRYAVEDLGSLGKKIAPAFIAMIDEKFTISPASRYVERGPRPQRPAGAAAEAEIH